MALALPGPTACPHPEWPQGPLVSSHPVHAWSDNPLPTPDVGSKVLILVCSASICSPSPASGGERPAGSDPPPGPRGWKGAPACHGVTPYPAATGTGTGLTSRHVQRGGGGGEREQGQGQGQGEGEGGAEPHRRGHGGAGRDGTAPGGTGRLRL